MDRSWRLRSRSLHLDRGTLTMGIINVTPDSFSDGGRLEDPAAGVAHGRALAAAGADILDVGGESTRPFAEPVSAEVEMARVLPVVEALAAEGHVVSIDTRKPEVAEAAIAVGAEIVNDVSGLRDPAMRALCAASGVGVVIMHMLGDPTTMQVDPRYDDVVAEVGAYLEAQAGLAEAAGVATDAIVVDPGLGFGKTAEHNLALVAGLDRLGTRPILVGASRKGTIGTVLRAAGIETAPEDRDVASAAVAVAAVLGGASVIRAHDVGTSRRATIMADAIVRARRTSEAR